MGYDTSHFPGFEELRPFLRANYGFQMAFIKALDGYEWLSWLVQDISPSHEGHGTKFVLKVGGIEKDRNVATEVQWRQAMMKQLTNHGIVCPEVLPTTSGTLHCFYKDDNGVEYVIHMLTYVEGVPLRERRSREPQSWFRLGQMVGHVREVLKTLHIPGLEKRELFFRIERTGDFRKHLDERFKDPQERDVLTKALDMFDEFLAPNLHNLERGVIHHDLHEGNIICLDQAARQGTGHAGTEALSQFGVIDFGDMTISCRVFDLSLFLHLGTQCKETPPKEYVDYLKRSSLERNCKTSDRVNRNQEQGSEAGGFELKAGQSVLETSSHEIDEVVLAGHAIAGYLTTSSLTELEWEVLLASVCARYTIILMCFRGNLPVDLKAVENMAPDIWNAMISLKRLVNLGKNGVNAIWKGICKDYGIVC